MTATVETRNQVSILKKTLEAETSRQLVSSIAGYGSN